jgi:hypothetical protein
MAAGTFPKGTGGHTCSCCSPHANAPPCLSSRRRPACPSRRPRPRPPPPSASPPRSPMAHSSLRGAPSRRPASTRPRRAPLAVTRATAQSPRQPTPLAPRLDFSPRARRRPPRLLPPERAVRFPDPYRNLPGTVARKKHCLHAAPCDSSSRRRRTRRRRTPAAKTHGARAVTTVEPPLCHQPCVTTTVTAAPCQLPSSTSRPCQLPRVNCPVSTALLRRVAAPSKPSRWHPRCASGCRTS